jgi:NAD(P)-dependent dehydrogenase (short-subunit alcohol dehydrogenase family)
MTLLRDQVSLITGASRGIGRAVALALAREGAKVVLAARTSAALDAVAAEVRAAGGAALPVAADVRRRSDCDGAVERAVREFGRLDILVNNAAEMTKSPVAATTDVAWRSMFATNLDGPFYLCRAAVPVMAKQGSGAIVNIASLAGTNGIAGQAAYCATKFGLIGFTESLMLEVRQQGIRVAVVCPGSVNTGFGGKAPEPDLWKIDPDDVAHAVLGILTAHPRTLISRVEVRPLKPPAK